MLADNIECNSSFNQMGVDFDEDRHSLYVYTMEWQNYWRDSKVLKLNFGSFVLKALKEIAEKKSW